MSDNGRPVRSMIEVLQQDKADAEQDRAILTQRDAPAPGAAYRKMMTLQLGDDTMQKMDSWLEIASFETYTRRVAELLYEWTTKDCSVTHQELYAMCEKLMGEFAELLVSLGVITAG